MNTKESEPVQLGQEQKLDARPTRRKFFGLAAGFAGAVVGGVVVGKGAERVGEMAYKNKIRELKLERRRMRREIDRYLGNDNPADYGNKKKSKDKKPSYIFSDQKDI